MHKATKLQKWKVAPTFFVTNCYNPCILLFIVLNSYSGLTLYLIQSSLHFVKQCAALWVINKSTIWSTDISHSSPLNIKFCKFISCVLLRYCGFLLSSLLLFNSLRSPLSECLEQAREKPTKQEILQVYVAKKLRVYRVIILKQMARPQ